MHWVVYLSGEIHTDWREQIRGGAERQGLPVSFVSPVTDHEASDAAGDGLGAEQSGFIRTKTMIEQCDIAVIRFGDKYKQWNAAFDAGYCAATNTPYITLHDEDIIHPLKEVDASAMAWAQTPDQVIDVLKYVTTAE